MKLLLELTNDDVEVVARTLSYQAEQWRFCALAYREKGDPQRASDYGARAEACRLAVEGLRTGRHRAQEAGIA